MFKKHHPGSKWMMFYIISVLVSELTSYYTITKAHNTNSAFIFNISLVLYILFVSLFFYNTYSLVKIKFFYIILSAITLITFAAYFYNVQISEFKISAYLIGSCFIVLSSIYYFAELIVVPNELSILSSPSFYFSAGLLIIYSFIIVYMGLLPQLLSTLKKYNVDVRIFKSAINYISYSLILSGYICLLRKQT